jgi:hypothetical protein
MQTAVPSAISRGKNEPQTINYRTSNYRITRTTTNGERVSILNGQQAYTAVFSRTTNRANVYEYDHNLNDDVTRTHAHALRHFLSDQAWRAHTLFRVRPLPNSKRARF